MSAVAYILIFTFINKTFQNSPSLSASWFTQQLLQYRRVKYEDDASMTAGLEETIVIKVAARVMVRRNIDVSLGLSKWFDRR